MLPLTVREIDDGRSGPDGSRQDRAWPRVFVRLAMAAGRLLGRSFAGLIGLAVVGGVLVPRHDGEDRTWPGHGDSPRTKNTVILEVPGGEVTASLIVVDATGRELAVLTRWGDGTIGVAARRGDGAGLWCGLRETGETFANLIGTAKNTHITAQPDGTARICESPSREMVATPRPQPIRRIP